MCDGERHGDETSRTQRAALRQLSILVVVFCLGGVYATSAQTDSTTLSQDFDEGAIRERIATIIRETLKQGEGTTFEGYRFYTWIPASNEAVEEIKSYGEKAIWILEEYLFSDVGREGNLVLRILGRMGGSGIVEPLKRVVEQSMSPWPRQEAVRALTQAPWELASPIVRNAAETDRNPEVRAEARDLLIRYAPKREPN
jgi:hypothetical protein